MLALTAAAPAAADQNAAQKFFRTKLLADSKVTHSVKVTLKKGLYKFVCDPHAGIMKGSFKVS